MGRWFELTGRDLPASTAFGVVCPIVKPISITNGTWKNLPLGINEGGRFGWNPKDNTLSVLDTTLLINFKVGEDPEDLDFLFQKEADLREREEMRVAQTATDKGIRAKLTEEAHSLFLSRFIRYVKIANATAFTDPDPTKYWVMVHTKSSNIISDGDIASIIRRPGTSSISQIRASIQDFLGGMLD